MAECPLVVGWLYQLSCRCEKAPVRAEVIKSAFRQGDHRASKARQFGILLVRVAPEGRPNSAVEIRDKWAGVTECVGGVVPTGLSHHRIEGTAAQHPCAGIQEIVMSGGETPNLVRIRFLQKKFKGSRLIFFAKHHAVMHCFLRR